MPIRAMPGLAQPNGRNQKYSGEFAMRMFVVMCLAALSGAAQAQFAGIPASDTLGGDDLAYNPTFIGGVANGGSTSHGVW